MVEDLNGSEYDLKFCDKYLPKLREILTKVEKQEYGSGTIFLFFYLG